MPGRKQKQPLSTTNRHLATRPMDIPLQDPRKKKSDGFAVFPSTPDGNPPDSFVSFREFQENSNTDNITSTVTLPQDSKITKGFSVPLQQESGERFFSGEREKPVMIVKPLLPEDPLPELKSDLSDLPESDRGLKSLDKTVTSNELNRIDNAWTMQEIHDHAEEKAQARKSQGLPEDKDPFSRGYFFLKDFNQRKEPSAPPSSPDPESPHQIIKKKKWELQLKDLPLDQICKKNETEQQHSQQGEGDQAVPKKQTSFELSKRTTLRTTPTKQLEFEIGPLEPDPQHVNAVVKFSSKAFIQLKDKFGTIKKDIEKMTNQGYTEMDKITEKTVHSPIKRHLVNQWYVEIQSDMNNPNENVWVNLLSINRKGEKNFNNCVFLTGQEWGRICFYEPNITQNLLDIKVPLPAEKKCIINKALMYTYKCDKKDYTGKIMFPHQRYFFSPEHALESAKFCFGNCDLTMKEMELDINLVSEYVDPPCINTFLMDCFMFYLFTELCNYHLEMAAVPSICDKIDAFELIRSIRPQDVVDFLEKKMQFPQKYLEQCFLQYHLYCGLAYPVTGSTPYIDSFKKFVRLHYIINTLFHWEDDEYGSIDLDKGSPNHFLRKEVFYLMYPDQEANYHQHIYKVSDYDMCKLSY